MGVNEFRIGNWFYNSKEHETQVYKIDEDSVNGIIYTDFCGIVLTEEWLLKFGWDKVVNGWWDETETFSIDDGFFCFCTDRLIKCKYVHQLQNLYFALVGKELTLKE